MQKRVPALPRKSGTRKIFGVPTFFYGQRAAGDPRSSKVPRWHPLPPRA